jgi:hypothetical protein
MKVAILSESPADEAAASILVEAVHGSPIEIVDRPRLRSGGAGAVLADLPMIIKATHYRSEAEALITIVDSDDTELHTSSHEAPAASVEACRLCQIRRIIEETRGHLKPIAARPPLLIAVGIAIPAIEAWYLYGKKPVSEAAWIQGQQSPPAPYDRSQLKRWAYGSDRPTLADETRVATEETTRVIGNLESFEKYFPSGFGSLAAEIRRWKPL